MNLPINAICIFLAGLLASLFGSLWILALATPLALVVGWQEWQRPARPAPSDTQEEDYLERRLEAFRKALHD